MAGEAGTPADRYRRWLNERAARLREGNVAPRTTGDARRRGAKIRRAIRAAERDAFLTQAEKPPLDPQILGTLDRDGYRIERLIFQTQRGVYATAHSYVPAGKGPFSAVLCVHGHWAGARRDPVVQSRCVGLAKLGFFVLTLDAWGAGERGTRPGQNEYHGGLLGASLWPVGTPLHGLQLWDNVRALDYLQSRPEVDGKRLGCTGASGGGNQTTYLTAFDERVRCGVPVCSVGTFRSYLDTACCVDEVLLGGLTFAEEGDLLGMAAPRALMVITATRDSYHFGPKASGEALERAGAYFAAHGCPERVKHVLIDSGHDYSRPMREAMYGWMSRWLKGEGDGSPIPEPEIRTEDPELLRCFDPSRRPERVMTTVQWVEERARSMTEHHGSPTGSGWPADRARKLDVLTRVLQLPRMPRPDDLFVEVMASLAPDDFVWRLGSEPGLYLPQAPAPLAPRPNPDLATVLLLHPDGMESALKTRLAQALMEARVPIRLLEPRGSGGLKLSGQDLGAAIPDHNLVEWSLWIGRPLLGQLVHDTLALLAALQAGGPRERRRVAVVGWREAGLVALLAAALDRRVIGAAAIETLATYTTPGPPHNQRMAVFQPDLLKVGDVPHLAALSAPRPVLVANPVRLDGAPASAEDLETLYHGPRELYASLGHADRLVPRRDVSDEEIATTVRSWVAAKN